MLQGKQLFVDSVHPIMHFAMRELGTNTHACSAACLEARYTLQLFLHATRDRMRVIFADDDAPPIEAVVDVGHARDRIHRCNVYGGLIKMWGCPLITKVRRFNAECATAQSEYLGANHMTDLAAGFKNLMIELYPDDKEVRNPIQVFMDASASIHGTVAPTMSETYRHFPIHFHKHRLLCQHGEILMRKVEGTENPTNQLTKPYSSRADFDRESRIWYRTHEELLAEGNVLMTADMADAWETQRANGQRIRMTAQRHQVTAQGHQMTAQQLLSSSSTHTHGSGSANAAASPIHGAVQRSSFFCCGVAAKYSDMETLSHQSSASPIYSGEPTGAFSAWRRNDTGHESTLRSRGR